MCGTTYLLTIQFFLLLLTLLFLTQHITRQWFSIYSFLIYTALHLHLSLFKVRCSFTHVNLFLIDIYSFIIRIVFLFWLFLLLLLEWNVILKVLMYTYNTKINYKHMIYNEYVTIIDHIKAIVWCEKTICCVCSQIKCFIL